MGAMRLERLTKHLLGLLLLGLALAGISCSTTGGLDADQQHASPDTLQQQAETAYRAGDLSAARQHYMQLLQTAPAHLEAQFKLGVIAYRQGQFEESRTHFLKVLAQDSAHHKATYNLGVIYAAEGEFKNTEKATFFFDKYLQLVPNAPQKEKILRWKSLQSSGKRRQPAPTVRQGGRGAGDVGTMDSGADDLKQWLQQEAEQAEP
ncbi:MAG: tetratricopeptide repeat protein [Desulfosarcinaceae bacterium]|nr:tetratricopeptide repeat protein [Desulfosarcinaceae bacterium]